jgi:hypothetical protein
MTALLAIFRLTLRGALRERVVWSMLALLAGVLFLLPMGLRGDGTLDGDIRMHVRYGLGMSAGLLAAMTVWMSCAAVAGDLATRRLHMVLAKPVGRGTVWFGKWLAITCMSTFLLLACGAVVLVRIHLRVRDSGAEQARIDDLRARVLTARAPVPPQPVNVSAAAQAMLEEQKARGLPADVPMKVLLDEINGIALAMRHAANQGETVSWDFVLDPPLGADEPLQLAYRFDGASMGIGAVPGEWRVGTEEEPNLVAIPLRQSPAGEYILRLNQEGAFGGATRVRVEFHNLSQEREMVFFDPDDGVLLYRPGGHFGPNLFRALLLLSGLLALLAALGVSAGALFSLPVACYVTAVLLLFQSASGVVARAAEEGTSLGQMDNPGPLVRAMDHASQALYRGLAVVLRPLDLDDPLDRVARGVLVSPGELFSHGVTRMLPILAAIALAGIGLFHKREAGGGA